MSQHDPLVRLRHTLDHAREANALARGRSRRDLDTDRMLNLALSRLLVLVGEGAARTPEGLRSNHPDVPWRAAMATRDRLVDHYDEANSDVMWRMIHDDLPPLIDALQRMLAGQV
jgi:uncharacterized protein with HEPN domain